jgi:hypothetical protein
MISDILIYETGQGGDLLLRANDLVTITGYENTPYLAMFGGADWSGNDISDTPFSSKTETVLRNATLTSAGRIDIENAIKADLSFLDEIPGTTWSQQVTVAGVNRVDIVININGVPFNYSWNPDTFFLTYQV